MLANVQEGWYTIKVFSAGVEWARDFFWGIPTVMLILGVGIAVTLLCGFPQIRLFSRAFSRFRAGFAGRGDRSSYRALCTALASTVGTGNIAGVAGAIAIGGPGAVFWMWISAFFGMATKFGESILSVRFPGCDRKGNPVGGPMYVIRNALPERWHFLASLYCFFGLFAAFGVGNATQINAVFGALREAATGYGLSLSTGLLRILGLFMALAVGVLVSGGAERIGRTAEFLVPIAALAYVTVCVICILLRWSALPGALYRIVSGAFQPGAVTGGTVSGMILAMRTGVARGVFTNEAGMGTAAMAHGSARVNHPVEQGMMGIMEVFLDTLVICTLTALVILTSGISVPYGADAGSALTARALSADLGPWASAFLSGCLCLFALATVLGWGLYAGRCAEFLLGSMNWAVFALCQGLCVLVGAFLNTGLIWSLSDLMNALMALPNLTAMILLLPELRRLTIDYENNNCG